MTPNNIVNMAKLKGLNIIAITDHNSARNIAATISCAKDVGILCLPGMEVESTEEIHLIVLFSDLISCFKMEKVIEQSFTNIKNDINIFGEQIIVDKNDNITGYKENLLTTATNLTVAQIFELTEKLGGVCIPAHIDRDSYSIISTFGMIPEDIAFSTVEITKNAIKRGYGNNISLCKYNIISSSDAHCLGFISERENYFKLSNLTGKDVIEKLKTRIK